MKIKDLKQKAESYIDSLLSSYVPNGKWDGNEYVFLNPSRVDSKLGSCKFNRLKMKYTDFANGDSGDIIDIIRMSRNIDNKSAIQELKEFVGEEKNISKPIIKKESKVELLDELPPYPAKNITHYRYGEPLQVWEHRTIDDQLKGYICRFNTDKGKQDLPYYWGLFKKSGQKNYIFKALDKPRMLFGLETLQRTAKTIIVVEGQKCASALSQVLPLPVVTWTQGTNSLCYSDWSPIVNDGRNIIFWPDNDRPGKKALESFKNEIKKDFYSVEIPKDKPKGWDCADMIDEGVGARDIAEFIKNNKVLVRISSDNQEIKNTEINESKNIEINESKEPFLYLGHDHKRYYYFPKKLQQIKSYTASEHTISNLLELADITYWESYFPKSNGGVDVSSALNTMIRHQEQKGVYIPEHVRGRGIWLDDGKVVVHTGNQLVIDNKKTSLSIVSKYTYERAQSLNIKLDEKLSDVDANKFYHIVDGLNFEHPESAKWLSGWLVVSAIAGCLKWRPHMWLTARAGTGKSWVLNEIIKPSIGDSINALGKSSEAGIRQMTNSDSLPILIDEFEAMDKKGKDRVDGIIELARQSSCDTEAMVLKGTAHGKAMAFRPRGIFCFVSVGVNIEHQADEDRITVLNLKKIKKQKDFQVLQKETYSLIDEEFSGKLISRTVENIDVIKKSMEIINNYLTPEFGKRFADQYSPLYAGAWSLLSTEPITETELKRFVNINKDFACYQQSDEDRCLELIMESIINCGGVNRSVSELIESVFDFGRNPHKTDDNFSVQDAVHNLGLHGIKVDTAKGWERSGKLNSDSIFIANKHKQIDRFLENSAFCGNHSRYLERIKNCEKNVTCRFAGTQKRAIKINYNYNEE